MSDLSDGLVAAAARLAADLGPHALCGGLGCTLPTSDDAAVVAALRARLGMSSVLDGRSLSATQQAAAVRQLAQPAKTPGAAVIILRAGDLATRGPLAHAVRAAADRMHGGRGLVDIDGTPIVLPNTLGLVVVLLDISSRAQLPDALRCVDLWEFVGPDVELL